jgi:lysophospholipase L1-like esterase
MRRSRVLVVLLGVLLGLAGVEGLVRLRQWKRYGTTATSYYRFAIDPATALRIPEPGHSIGPIHVNSLGFRGPEIEQPKPPGRVRVAFLGGSTTFCVEASSFETSWPFLVVAGLRADARDIEFDLVTGGAAGFTTEQSLLSLERRVAPLEPDVIVIYCATNDLTVDSRRLAIQHGLYVAGESDHAPIGDWWMTWFLIEKNVRHYLQARRGTEARLHVEPRTWSGAFEERLTRLVEAAQARAPVVALVTFSVQLRADQDPERLRAAAASALFLMPFFGPEALSAAYAEYNRVVRAVAAATGVILVEGEDDIPGDSRHFADSVHLRDPGLALQAQRVLRGLRTAPAYAELLSRRRAGLRD